MSKDESLFQQIDNYAYDQELLKPIMNEVREMKQDLKKVSVQNDRLRAENERLREALTNCATFLIEYEPVKARLEIKAAAEALSNS